ncbi:MAG: HU family DNA-binding protein [Bacteroides sp.]|jgi:nucleoid DNA-binding protein|nr:HU family DNA-binding protein [Bacteroides sp.]
MNEKLNMQDFVAVLAERHGMSKKNADSFVKEFFQLIEEALEIDKYVKIKGLGTFKLIDVDSRESVNVNTGERFEIQGHTKVSFTPEPALKEFINKPFSHFETVALNDESILCDTFIEKGEENGEKDLFSKNSTEKMHQPKDVHQLAISGSEKDEKYELDNSLKNENVDISHSYEKQDIGEPLSSEEVIPAVSTSIALKKTSNASTMKYFIGIIAFIIILCGGAIAFIYYPEIFNSSPLEHVENNNNISNKPNQSSDTLLAGDSIAKADTLSILEEPQKTTVIAPKSIKGKSNAGVQSSVASQMGQERDAMVSFVPDSTNYKILGTKTTYTIKEGETLTKVSFHFYGTKALWPYIVKYNHDIIKNADNVPFGTVVRIPELSHK